MYNANLLVVSGPNPLIPASQTPPVRCLLSSCLGTPGEGLDRLLEAGGLFEMTCFSLKIHENFALSWACFNATSCVKLLFLVNEIEAVDGCLSITLPLPPPPNPHPVTFQSAGTGLVRRQPFCCSSCPASITFWYQGPRSF